MEEDPQVCQNCNELFAPNIIDLHEAYCRRNIRKCPLCSRMVDLNEQENHKNEFHANKPCPYCQEPLSPPQLISHLPTCPQRPVECKYCQNTYPFATSLKHEEECGARTKQCELCRKWVMLKAEQEHTAICQRNHEMRRNESHQERRMLQQNRVVRERLNSNDNGKKQGLQAPSPRLLPPKRPQERITIEREPISQLVDPVPISVRLAQQREKERKMK